LLLILAHPAISDEPNPKPDYDAEQGIRFPRVSGASFPHTVAADDQFSIRKRSSFVDLDVLDNDAALGSTSSELVIVATGETSSGGKLINNVSHLTYFPPPGFTGVDSFTYTMADQSGITSNANVFVKNMVPWRIMPIGDSITEASGSRDSYRRPLWHLLNDAGLDIEFVGSRSGNRDGQVPNPDFDTEHEGHWGWRADQIITGAYGKVGLSELLDRYTPDIVLIHLGSNDIFQGEATGDVISDIRNIVRVLIRANPDIAILIAQLIPVANDTINMHINKLNSALANLPQELDLADQLIIVNQNDGFISGRDSYDGIHPNLRGEEKMASVWFDQLKKVIPLISH